MQLMGKYFCQYTADACVLNQLCIEDKSDVELSDSSNKGYSDYESGNEDEDENDKSDNNDED